MKKLFFFSMLMLFSTAPAFSADYDGQETNGGNGYSAEFFKIFDWAVGFENDPCWESGFLKPMTEHHIQELRWKLVVRSEPEVFLDGVSVGAINQPGLFPLVVLAEKKWKNSSEDQKKALVLHEIFHLVGFDDGDYSYSSGLLGCIDSLKLKNAQLKEAFLRCDETFLRSLTEYGIRTVSAPIRDELFQLAISGKCAEGFRALQKNVTFGCDLHCQSQICEVTDEIPVRPQSEQSLRQLDFLETVLQGAELKKVDLSACGWKICKHPQMSSQIEAYPSVQRSCSLSFGSN